LLTQVPNEALQAAYLLNHATSIADAQKAASQFSAPGLNVMYGDVDGNIAWWAVAKLPIRPPHLQSKLFLDGSGKDEYLGFYDFPKNPHSINPPQGFVYSANNQPDSIAGVLHPGYYYPKARAGRIVQLLSADKKWTPGEIQGLDLDVVSITAPEIAKEIASVLASLNKPGFSKLTGPLEKWNGDHKASDVAPSVYYNMLSQIMAMAMKDELGKTAYNAIMATSVPKNSYLMFIKDDTSPWWDDVRTKEVKETRAIIFERAAAKTLSLLESTSGKDPKDWTWGKIHTLTHAHPLAAVKPLDKFFNVGNEVINNLHFDLDTMGYFPVRGGPALRKITDFGDVDHGMTVSPTGQSGNVMSPFYDDQAKLFVTGKFRKMLMNRKEIESVSKNKLLLKPLQ